MFHHLDICVIGPVTFAHASPNSINLVVDSSIMSKNIFVAFAMSHCVKWKKYVVVFNYVPYTTPGIQKHVTVLNTRNGDILRSGNIKGGMFWCLHINTFEDVSTRDVHSYLEHNFWDNSMKFHILMWYIKLIIQFYYFGFLFLVMLSVLTN